MLTEKAKVFLMASMLVVAACVSAAAQSTDPALLNNQGVEFYSRGNFSAAIVKFEAAALLDQSNFDIFLNLGYAYQAVGKFDESASAFKKAVSLSPEDVEAHNALGVSLYKAGKKDQAMQEWKFVLTVAPDFAPAAANVTMARSPQNADDIYNETKRALDESYSTLTNTDALDKLFDRGKRAYFQGSYDVSRKVMSDVLEVKPTSKFSYFYLGMSQAYLGDATAAMKSLREYMILESYPPESPGSYEKAMITFRTLKTGGSIAKGVVSGNILASSAFSKGKALYKQGDYFKAILLLKEAYTRKSDSFATNYYLGLAYRAVGDKERATFHLTKCLMTPPDVRIYEENQSISSILRELTK